MPACLLAATLYKNAMRYRIIVMALICWVGAAAEDTDRGRVFDLRLETVDQLPHGGSQFLQGRGEHSLPFATASGRLHVVSRDGALWVGPEVSELRQVSPGKPFTVPVLWGDAEAEYALLIEDHGHGWMRIQSCSVAVAEVDGLRLSLVDSDFDGAFNAIGSDHMHLTGAGDQRSSLSYDAVIPLAEVVTWHDQPWTLDVSALPRVVMQPYEGPITHLRLALSEQMERLDVTVMGDDDAPLAGRWRIEAGQTIMVPSGRYTLAEVTIMMRGQAVEAEPASGIAGTWIGRLVGADRPRRSQPMTWLNSSSGGDVMALEPGEHDLVLGPPFTAHADPAWLHGVLVVTEVGLRGQAGESYQLHSQDDGSVPEWFLEYGDTTRSLGRLEYG